MSDYAIISGSSMQPVLRSGDLVVLRPSSSYRVGEVVAYHSAVLHAVVLHRIVSRDGSHFVFKGDNNSWLDPAPPTQSALIGTLWLTIPYGGSVLGWLVVPWHAGLLIGGMVLVLTAAATASRGRRARHRRAVNHPHLRPWPAGIETTLAGVGAIAVAIMAVAFVWPATRSTSILIPYTQQMRLSYGARVTPSLVYPNGKVENGQPIFRSFVHDLVLTADYQLATKATGVGGSAALAVTLHGPNGWARTLPLLSAQGFKGATARISAVLNLSALDATVQQVGELTHLAVDEYSITIIPMVHVWGVIGGHRLTDIYAPPWNFLVNSRTMQPAQVPSPAGSALNPAGVGSATRSLVRHSPQETEWTFHGRHLPIGALRMVSGIVALIALLLVGLGLLIARRSSRGPGRICGRSIITVSEMSFDPHHNLVDVPDVRALFRIAERYDRLILRADENGIDTYFVDDDSAVYRYRPSMCTAGIARKRKKIQRGAHALGVRL